MKALAFLISLSFTFPSTIADETDALKAIYEERDQELVELVTDLQRQIDELEAKAKILRGRLPKEPQQIRPTKFVFTIKDGQISIGGEVVPATELETKLKAVARVIPSTPLKIEAPEGTPWKDVLPLIRACLKAGLWNFEFLGDRP